MQWENNNNNKKKHFILVHGAGHGAWCWYKLSSLLESLGHHVTALDLASCGVNPKRVDEVRSLDDYVHPFMEAMASLPPDHRAILVGHSFGGIGISLAMERFPEKVAAGVYVTAIMPKACEPMINSMEFFKRDPFESMLDTTFNFGDGREGLPTSVLLGPEYLAKKLYQCCSSEDMKLATALIRPTGLFAEDLTKEGLLSEENFGSVKRVFVVCGQDDVDLQRWSIQHNPPDEVVAIDTANHMVMLSHPRNLCDCLLEIADKYH
ncbi:Salicylic acid-binding protein 2 [Acorus gramineus]|uniref:Salicylic acid-binding protein 2 n=1 Tax=Acorus gramineus TaxID=55184 RepID=A0AAV9AVN9_ACOGR|nr:Salicylic acid-binding protein 2 [Acorus gramineus]